MTTINRKRSGFVDYHSRHGEGTRRVERENRTRNPITVGVLVDNEHVIELTVMWDGAFEITRRSHGTRTGRPIFEGVID